MDKIKKEKRKALRRGLRDGINPRVKRDNKNSLGKGDPGIRPL